MARVWDDIPTEKDKLVYAAAGYGQRAGLGRKPTIIVIDVNYNFVGDKPEPILESIKRFHMSCGEAGWVAVRALQQVLPVAREREVPIFYSTGKPRSGTQSIFAGQWAAKNLRTGEAGEDDGHQIVAEIAPCPGDILIPKEKPSLFFATPLLSYLIFHNVDTVLVCGTTTSGCVRATVIDAFSYNFKVGVIEECTFDRGEVSHKVNLFDMNAKYADVMPVAEVLNYLQSIPTSR
jgi:maleamate amidohydrolase